MLEFHVVFDRRQFGPDSSSSIEIREIPELVYGVRFVSEALAAPMDKSRMHVAPELRRMFGKSLAVNADLPAGHRLRVEDLESKKPADCGIAAADFTRVLDRRLTRPLSRWDFLNEADLADD